MITKNGQVLIDLDGTVNITRFEFKDVNMTTGGLYALAWAKERIEIAQRELLLSEELSQEELSQEKGKS